MGAERRREAGHWASTAPLPSGVRRSSRRPTDSPQRASAVSSRPIALKSVSTPDLRIGRSHGRVPRPPLLSTAAPPAGVCTGRALTGSPSILRMRVDWRSRTTATNAIRSCARTQTPPKPKGTGHLAYYARGLMVFETALRSRVLDKAESQRQTRGKNQHAQPSQWRYAALPDHR